MIKAHNIIYWTLWIFVITFLLIATPDKAKAMTGAFFISMLVYFKGIVDHDHLMDEIHKLKLRSAKMIAEQQELIQKLLSEKQTARQDTN